MAALVAATGVHRQTIHFYLRKQLLPPPCEGPGTRDARYGEAHKELIQLIRELRDRQGLSLDAIRERFVEARFDPAAARVGLAGPPALASASGDLVTAEEACRLAEASEELLESLRAAGVAAPDPDDLAGRFDRGIVTTLRAARELEALGLPRETVLRTGRLAESLASAEIGALAADATAVDLDPAKLSERAEERHRGFGRLVSAVRSGAVGSVLRRLARIGPRTRSFAADAIYVPSALFVRRHGIEEALAAAQDRALSGGAEANLSLGRLLLGLGRYAEAAEQLSRCARLQPDDAETWASLGLATALSGREAEGAAFARRALTIAPESPRVHAFLGAVLALHAAATTGLGDASSLLREALKSAAHTRTLKAADTREELEVLIARGRLLTVMPAELSAHVTGADDLAEVVRRTEHATDAENGFDVPGTNALYRMHAFFYLGVAALQQRNGAEAARCLRECLTIDPASRFAERAYELLSTT